MSHPDNSTNTTTTAASTDHDQATAGQPADRDWRRTLHALHRAGTRAGRDHADWWAQDAVGGRTTADVRPVSAAVLAGIDDGDPAVLDTLPTYHPCGQSAEGGSDPDLYTDAAPTDAPGWNDLTPQRRSEAIETYRNAYDTAAHDRVVEHCRAVLDPDPTSATRHG